MRVKKDKGPLRNFYFEQKADEALVLRSRERGCHMTVILEDLLLDRRQFSPQIEQFLSTEIKRLGLSRQQIIEIALLGLMPKSKAQGQESRN